MNELRNDTWKYQGREKFRVVNKTLTLLTPETAVCLHRRRFLSDDEAPLTLMK